jgi:hypothetical protein
MALDSRGTWGREIDASNAEQIDARFPVLVAHAT